LQSEEEEPRVDSATVKKQQHKKARKLTRHFAMAEETPKIGSQKNVLDDVLFLIRLLKTKTARGGKMAKLDITFGLKVMQAHTHTLTLTQTQFKTTKKRNLSVATHGNTLNEMAAVSAVVCSGVEVG
jgi:hypothetical protein